MSTITTTINTKDDVKHYMNIPANILLCGLSCATTYESDDPNREDIIMQVEFTETVTQLVVTKVKLLFTKNNKWIVGSDITIMMHMPKFMDNIYKIISTETHRNVWDSDKRWWK